MPRPSSGLTRAEQDRLRKLRRRAQGLCKHCSSKAHGGTQMCLRHRLYQAAWRQQRRLAQKGAALG